MFILSEKGSILPCPLSSRIYRETAIIIYLYYIDTLPVYYQYIDNIPSNIDVYILSSKKQVLDEVNEHLNAFPRKNVHYLLKENTGRDVSALLVTGRTIVSNYKYICFLHDKKEHCKERKEDTQLWIENLWGNQIGSEDYIEGILNLFETHKNIGVLAPPEPIGRHFNTWYGYGWYGSFEATRNLAKKLCLKTNLRQDRPPVTLGTVLWFRSAALRKLFETGWKYSDFDDQKLDNGNYLSYAIERIFPYVAQDAGYDTGTVMASTYAAKEVNFLQYATTSIFTEMDLFFPVNNLDDVDRYKKNKNKVIKFAKCNKKVFLYGTGKMARLCLSLLKLEGIFPEGCLVSEGNTHHTFDFLPVIAADSVEHWGDMAVIITVYNPKMQEEILSVLRAHGCQRYVKFWDS